MRAALLVTLGIAVGSFVAAMFGCLFFLTRSYRAAGSRYVIALGYVLMPILVLGSFAALFAVLQAKHVGLGSWQAKIALYAALISSVCGNLVTLWTELRWRKSIGLREQHLVPKRDRKSTP